MTARGLVNSIMGSIVLFAIVRRTIFHAVVCGKSMLPTLGPGTHLIVYRCNGGLFSTSRFHPIRRGDVLAIERSSKLHPPLLKRLIGLPGDSIRISDGSLYINGSRVKEPYIADQPNYMYPCNRSARTLGIDEFFVLGDNRNASDDSHLFGPIKKEKIIGKAWLIIGPWPKMKVMSCQSYATL